MEWQSTSICFVRSWKTGLAAICTTLVLSAWIEVEWCWGKLSSPNNPRSQVISEQTEDIARYSDLVEDLKTLSCFLLFQEMSVLSKNMHQPVTKWWVSAQPAQLASLYPTNYKEDFLGKNNPHVEVPFIYQIMRWTTARWRFWGACINWLTCCIAKKISGQIIVK